MEINWQGDLEQRLPSDLLARLNGELKVAFARARKIFVRQQFSGYKTQFADKIVLGVEVRLLGAYRSYIVKIGRRAEVENDYTGWKRCVASQDVASRIFVNVEKHEAGADRVVILYENAYRFYEAHVGEPGVHALEDVVRWAVRDDKLDPISVERVLRQVFNELGRWFYRGAQADSHAVTTFYRNRLKPGLSRQGILECWNDVPERRKLRMDLIWLLCGQDAPDTAQDACYLDPYDYVRWALETEQLPETMIGSSHGDLHGRNIIVGVQRGEAEYPTVFDYGAMDTRNVLAWDFVKLELELKSRLLPMLYENQAAQAKALSLLPGGLRSLIPDLSTLPTALHTHRTRRISRLAFAFAFESLLTGLMDGIEQKDYQTNEPPDGRNITGSLILDRALAVFTRIRQEAALHLGQNQSRLTKRAWRDEYLFALAVYGLYSAKFDYDTPWAETPITSASEVAIVSAGVAVSHMEAARKQVQMEGQQFQSVPSCPTTESANYSSYRAALSYTHRLWKERMTERALEVSQRSIDCFPLAVPVIQQHALTLTVAGRYEEAIQAIEPLTHPSQGLCHVFRDRETLCRIGAIYKKMGDLDLEQHPVAYSELSKRAAFQHYRSAYEWYSEAYTVDSHYYPGINAATLAMLIGLKAHAEELARKVQDTCRNMDIGRLNASERFWVFATEGEACLLLNDGEAAVGFYQNALDRLPPSSKGMAQSAYDQVCRLFWMNASVTQPICQLLQDRIPELNPGPMGGCRQLIANTPPIACR